MLLASLRSRPPVLKFTLAVFMAVQMPGWICCARADETVVAAAVLPQSRATVQRALREFDRFLDHHPLLEDQLRVNPPLTSSASFLARTPELKDFLRANPKVAEGLQIYPRYFLNRALRTQASGPVSFADLAPFKRLFQQQPELERALIENPERIRDPVFLASHPLLHDCVVQHPALARVFLPPPLASSSK